MYKLIIFFREISIALNFNHIAKRFRDFEINSIEVCLYDTFYNNMPNTVQVDLHLLRLKF